MLYRALAYHYTWWRGDALPALPELPSFHVTAAQDLALLAQLHELDTATMQARIEEDNQPYIAWLGDTPVGYGWSATKTFGVAAAGLVWYLNPGERGLWNFATLPAWRGRRVYPHLLQAIIRQESEDAGRFWIAHRADNTASQRGICAAGFQLIGINVMTPSDEWVEVIRGDEGRARANPMLDNMRLIEAGGEELVLGDVADL